MDHIIHRPRAFSLLIDREWIRVPIYNARPQWLADAHTALDATLAAAYRWYVQMGRGGFRRCGVGGTLGIQPGEWMRVGRSGCLWTFSHVISRRNRCSRFGGYEVMALAHNDGITNRSVGQFDPKSWFQEGDGLLASSVKTREIWVDHREMFSRTIQERRSGGRDRAHDWNLLTGLPRASMLLLGYSVEMYLKAGFAKAYYGCSEEMFQRDIRKRFGHKLVSLAKEIAFPLTHKDKENLNLLKEMIFVDARYPVFVPDGSSYADTVNEQTERVWSSRNFAAFTDLTNRIQHHSRIIDADPSNPGSRISVNVDDDGYLAFRVGGNLPPRITYRLSSVQRGNCRTSLDDMKERFQSPKYQRLRRYWECAWILEDGECKTSLRAKPSG